MEFLVPWGNFVRKSGDTITGKMTILNDLDVEGQVTIIKDVTVTTDWHLALQSKTPAGILNVMNMLGHLGGWRGMFATDALGNFTTAHGASGANYLPIDVNLNPGRWSINSGEPILGGREMLLLHSLLMG